MSIIMESTPDTPKEPKRPAKQYAAWLLGQREWSAKELSARLKLKGYSSENVAKALEFCQTHEFQSDARFAASRTRSRARLNGNQKIAQELGAKGIAPHLIAVALQEAGPEYERASAAATRFQRSRPTPDVKAKAWRFLASRGFSGDVIKRVLKELWADVSFEDDEVDNNF